MKPTIACTNIIAVPILCNLIRRPQKPPPRPQRYYLLTYTYILLHLQYKVPYIHASMYILQCIPIISVIIMLSKLCLKKKVTQLSLWLYVWCFYQILISYCKFFMSRPLKWGIVGACIIIISKDIHKNDEK